MDPLKLANYNTARGAQSYKREYESKLHRQVSDGIERRIFNDFFARIGPSQSLLDLPCGAGRLFDVFAHHARFVIEADWSMPMLTLNRADHSGRAQGYVRCSALCIPLADRSVETAVSIRLSHHIGDPVEREQHLRELFRVAARAVIVTYFSHTSLKNLLRRIRAPFTGKRAKYTMMPGRVVQIASECGFERARLVPLSRLGSGHHFSLFVRRTTLALDLGR